MQWTSGMRRPSIVALVLIALSPGTLLLFRFRKLHHEVAASSASPDKTVPFRVTGEMSGQVESKPEMKQAGFDPDDAAAFASLADSAIAELHDGISLEQWRKSQENFEDWLPVKDEAFFDCRTFAKRETLPSGRQATHLVYFYPPEAATPAVFPTDSAEVLLDRDCKLSMVRVETNVQTDSAGRLFGKALENAFTNSYSSGLERTRAVFPRSAAWQEEGQWTNGAEIVSAYDPIKASYDREDMKAGTAFAFARLPIVTEIEQRACCRIEDHYHSIEESQFHHALEIAASDEALSAQVATLFRRLFRKIGEEESPDSNQRETARALVLPALRDWFHAANSLPPVRRAAMLYVADRLLVVASDNGWLDLIGKENTELRAGLEELGASFEYRELGGCYEYNGDWLSRARELDPEGRIGQMAVLISLARGSAPILPKDKGDKLDIFHTVISDGDWLLSQKPDAATEAQIHFIIGDANSTIFALAGGAETEYGDPKEYQPEAPAARHNALEHYRAGLAIDSTSENAKYAWLQAWKISAGLLPSTRYVYIYD